MVKVIWAGGIEHKVKLNVMNLISSLFGTIEKVKSQYIFFKLIKMRLQVS